MNPALIRLASVLPNDSAGSRAKNRFDFQRDWILCRILELYEAGRDFIVVCDYHDDVLVLDADPACANVEFYQVKTDAADRFTITRLTNRAKLKGGQAPSILGKLYAHRFRFSGIVGCTTLVTNFHPRLTAASPPRIEDRTRWTFVELAAEDQASISTSLSNEFSGLGSVTLDETFAFEATPLPVSAHDTFARGLLADFLHRRDGQVEHPVVALYRAVVDEIDRRSGEEGSYTSTADIVDHKCITKSTFETVLLRCLDTSRRGMADRVEQLVRAELHRAGVGARRTMRVSRAVHRFALRRVDPDNLRLARLSETAKAFWDDPNVPDSTLAEAMRAGAEVLRRLPEARGEEEDDLMAIVAWEMFNDREPASTTSKHEDEAP